MSRLAIETEISRINYQTAELIAPTLGREVAGFAASACQPYPQRYGKRLSAPGLTRPTLEGFTDIVEAEDGLNAIIIDWPASSPATTAVWVETLAEQCGYLYIGLEGDGRLDIEGLGQARRPGPSCFITIAPSGSKCLWRVAPNLARRGMCIAFHARYLRRQHTQLLERCMGTLGPWLANSETHLRDIEIPLMPVMTAATAALLASRLEGQSRYTLVRSTVEQLLCLAMSALAEASAAARLSTRERQIIQRVRAAIDANLADPPRVEDLARHFGINRTKLRLGFKEIFGVSAADYLHEQRMRTAFELLEQRHSVSAVAARVGYDHLCNFTTAFKRRFGRPPSKMANTKPLKPKIPKNHSIEA